MRDVAKGSAEGIAGGPFALRARRRKPSEPYRRFAAAPGARCQHAGSAAAHESAAKNPVPKGPTEAASSGRRQGRPRCLRKRRYLGVEPKKSQKMYVYHKEQFSWVLSRGRRGKRGIKNEGYSHDVIENTCRKNVSLGYSHDIHENKRLKSM